MVNEKTISIFLVAIFHVSLQMVETNAVEEYYRAAVVDFAPNGKQEDNLEAYEWFIKKTKENDVEIIVFPENSLHGVDGDIEKKLSEIPDPSDRIIPCRNNKFEKWGVLQRLSCAAQDHTMYTVVNLFERVPCNSSRHDCSSEGRIVYNTNVAFDKVGAVIARYRKYNLHDEYFFSKTERPELAMFDTDFGVRFGVITSFDILFQTPALDLVQFHNITNFVCPTYWYGELPFFTATQLQSGWSFSADINLLAAGVNKPSSGIAGSGIYVGRRGPSVFSLEENEQSTALVSLVPKNSRNSKSTLHRYQALTIPLNRGDSGAGTSRLVLQKDPTIVNSESIVLNENHNYLDERVCSGTTHCCHFRASYRKNTEAKDKSYVYRAVAYQGYKSFSKNASGAVETCAIILCVGPDIEDCGKKPNLSDDYFLIFENIIIEADFCSNRTIQMPNILLRKGLPDKETKMLIAGLRNYDFRVVEGNSSRKVRMELKGESSNIITFGIYGRDFGRNEGTPVVPYFAYLLCLPILLLSLNEC